MPEAQIIANSAEVLRNTRKVEPIITDYRTDERTTPYLERVLHYSLLHKDLGVQSVRWEARMSQLIKPNKSFDPVVAKAYEDSLRAMNEAGMSPSTVVLFTPEEWMIKLAKTSPTKFTEMYHSYAARVAEIYKNAGAKPKYVQVMNEINTGFQTKFSLDQCVDMIKITKDVFKQDFPDSKVMTTLITDTSFSKDNNEWKRVTKELVNKSGDSLDGIGFDFYPGSYKDPAIKIPRAVQDVRTILTALKDKKDPVAELQDKRGILGHSNAFDSFGQVGPYEWAIEEKLHGVLKGKDIVFSETGAPALSTDSKFQQFGYDRMVQSLSHLFTRYEQKGYAAQDLVAAVDFFTGADSPAVDTKAPGRLDFKPWTLVRKDADGNWVLTAAAKKLKGLIQSRLYTP